jgi:hypothetical protein
MKWKENILFLLLCCEMLGRRNDHVFGVGVSGLSVGDMAVLRLFPRRQRLVVHTRSDFLDGRTGQTLRAGLVVQHQRLSAHRTALGRVEAHGVAVSAAAHPMRFDRASEERAL